MNTQFDLGAMLGTPASLQNAVKQIPCDMLKPYHNHKFELYTGERLEDMIESIRKNGVLSPLIVQPCGNEYEILIGHNRWNASKLAGLSTVPCIIKEGLDEDMAEMYVIESNLLQRNFSELKISEQAAVIAQRHSKMFSQGKRNDIIRELQILENPRLPTLDPMGLKLEKQGDVNDNIGEMYGLGRTSIVRLIRIDKLIDELKALIDSDILAVRSGVELSFLSKETQLEISELAVDYKIDMKKSKLLRESADDNGNVSNADIIRILDCKKDTVDKCKSVKISNDVYSRYFEPTAKPKEIAETIEKALELYFENNEKAAD